MNQNDGLESLLKQYSANAKSEMFTSMPAKVVSTNKAEQRVDVQLLINRVTPDDQSVIRPIVISVPLVFPASKTSMFSFPVNKDDTVLVVFSMRNIDRFKGGSTSTHDPSSQRKLHRDDAIAIPGLFPFSQARNNPTKHTLDHSTDDCVMVHNLGTSSENEVRLKASGDIIINSPTQVQVNCTTAEINASESVTIDSPQTTVTGNMLVEGMFTYVAGLTGSGGTSSTATITGNIDLIGEMFINGGSVNTHTHSGVDAGDSSSDAPNEF